MARLAFPPQQARLWLHSVQRFSSTQLSRPDSIAQVLKYLQQIAVITPYAEVWLGHACLLLHGWQDWPECAHSF